MPTAMSTPQAEMTLLLQNLEHARRKQIEATQCALVALRDAFYPRLQKLAAVRGWTLIAPRKVSIVPLRFLCWETLALYMPWREAGIYREMNLVWARIRTHKDDSWLLQTLNRPNIIRDQILPDFERKVENEAAKIPPDQRNVCLAVGWDGADTAFIALAFLPDRFVPPAQHPYLEAAWMPPPPPQKPKKRKASEELARHQPPPKRRRREV